MKMKKKKNPIISAHWNQIYCTLAIFLTITARFLASSKNLNEKITKLFQNGFCVIINSYIKTMKITTKIKN